MKMTQQNVNVICVCDTETTQKNGPNNGSTLYMLSDQGANTPGQGTSEITITVDVGDTINWTITPLINFMTITLTNFVQTSGAGILQTTKTSSTTWQANCIGAGQVTYHFNFTILHDSNTYWWDPYININP
jgi:plastocyanin